MISLTGGFNQQYMGAEIKVAKERLVRDTLVLSDAITSHLFRTRMLFTDSLILSDIVALLGHSLLSVGLYVEDPPEDGDYMIPSDEGGSVQFVSDDSTEVFTVANVFVPD
jgi:hypothetical protein